MNNRITLSEIQRKDVIAKVEDVINNGYTDRYLINGDQISEMAHMYNDTKDFFDNHMFVNVVEELLNTVKSMHYDSLGWFALLNRAEKNVINPDTLTGITKLLVNLYTKSEYIHAYQVQAGKITEA